MKWCNVYFEMQLNDSAEEIWSNWCLGGLEKSCFHRCSNMKRYRSIFFPSGKPISIARLTMEKGKTVVSTSTMFIYNKSVRIVFQLFIRNDFARLELIEKLVEKREWRCEMTITSMRGKRA